MKANIGLFFPFLIIGLLLIHSCENPQSGSGDFVVTEKSPANALTIGWYLPVGLLDELVGEAYKPKVVKDDDLGSIMLFIVKSKEHLVDGKSTGPMQAAHLLVPIETPDKLETPKHVSIEGSLACPLNIIDKSRELGDKFNEHTFATYSGTIELSIEKSDETYVADASVITSNGLIEIRGMFNEEEQILEMNSAMFSTKSTQPAYFYGKERTTRIKDGRGGLKTEGGNIIDAMQLADKPFFLRLDRDMSWSFDFMNEGTGKAK